MEKRYYHQFTTIDYRAAAEFYKMNKFTLCRKRTGKTGKVTGKVTRWTPRKRETTGKTTRHMEKMALRVKARNGEKPLLMFRARVTARMMLGMKAMTPKTRTIGRST